MPVISDFHGIVVSMYYDDHPPPHFHARYNEDEVVMQVDPVAVLQGWLPGRCMRRVLPWSAVHQAALKDNWARARRGESLRRIPGWEH